MSFNFAWPTFSPEFYANAIETLTVALNRGQKPKAIVGDIRVQELHMGHVPPELEILEIGDLSKERFRGIFRLMYAGDAHLEFSTGVQANPLARPDENFDLFAGPATSRGMLFAASPLTVPMRVRLSDVKLRAIVVLVVSRTKGITLVFKNDPLESVRVSSTFDSVGVIQKYLQEEIETQLREMFRSDLPSIIHQLSQRWLHCDADEPRLSRGQPPTRTPPRWHGRLPWTRRSSGWPSEPEEELPLSMLALEEHPRRLAPVATCLARLTAENSPRGLKDLCGADTPSTPQRARTFHVASRMRFPAMVGTGTPPMYAVPPGNGHALDVSGHLAELLRANQTLSPYTQSPRHIALRTAPGHHNVRSGRAHARQRRKFSLNSES